MAEGPTEMIDGGDGGDGGATTTSRPVLADLPVEVVGLVLGFFVRDVHDLIAAGRVSRLFRAARAATALNLSVEEAWFSGREGPTPLTRAEVWAAFADWLGRTSGPALDSLTLHRSGVDAATVAKFCRCHTRLTALNVSRSYGVDGPALFQFLTSADSVQSLPALRCASLVDLPRMHQVPLPPLSGALEHIVALGLNDAVLDVDGAAAAGAGTAPSRFSERLFDALAAGGLPALTHLFLGGARLVVPDPDPDPDPDPAVGREEGDEVTGAAEPRAHRRRRRRPLAVLEVTFLEPRVRQWLSRPQHKHVVDPVRTRLIDLARSPCALLEDVRTCTPAVRLAVGAAADCRDPGVRFTPLHTAAACGDTARVEWLLRAGAHTELKDVRGSTALFRAAERDHVGCVQALLRFGASPFAANHRSESPLFIAALKGSRAAVVALLQFVGRQAAPPGAAAPQPPPRVRARRGSEAAAGSQARGGSAAAAAAAEEDTRPPQTPPPRQLNPDAAVWTPKQARPPSSETTAAAREPSPDKAAARAGATKLSSPVEQQISGTADADGFSPLHAAVLRRSAPTLKALLDARSAFGLEFGLFTKHRQTPLHLACRGGSAGIPLVEMLLDHLDDADAALLNIRDDTGATPLDVAMGIGSHTSSTIGRDRLIDVLRQRGAVNGAPRKGGNRRRNVGGGRIGGQGAAGSSGPASGRNRHRQPPARAAHRA